MIQVVVIAIFVGIAAASHNGYKGMILGSGGVSAPGGAVVLAVTLLQTMGLPLTVVSWIAGI